jgi:hypothetical protein
MDGSAPLSIPLPRSVRLGPREAARGGSSEPRSSARINRARTAKPTALGGGRSLKHPPGAAVASPRRRRCASNGGRDTIRQNIHAEQAVETHAAERARFWVIAVVLPVLWTIFVYSGFTSNYTGGVFTESSFVERYQGGAGIARFRVLGPFLLLQIVDLLEQVGSRLPIHVWGRNILSAVTPFDYHVYEGYLLLNAAASLAWSVVLGSFLRRALQPRSDVADLLLLATQAVIALTAFTVTPYDHLSYLFITLLFSGFVLRYPTWLLVLVTVLGALTRESVALGLLAAGASAGAPALLQPSPRRSAFWLMAASFGATYLGLRLALGFDAVVERGMLGFNLRAIDVLSVVGVAFGLIAATLPALFSGFSRAQRWFLLGALPYWIVILLSGIWFEVRLYVPLLLGSLLIAVTELGRSGTSPRTPPAAATEPVRAQMVQ